MTTSVDFLPTVCQAAGMRKVVAIVEDGVEAFGLGAICEVWGEPYHPEDDNPVFDFTVCTPRPGRIRGAFGYDLVVEAGLEAVEDADLVCVVPKREFLEANDAVSHVLRRAAARGAWIFAHCTGAFALAHAGLLDGRRCTTHWRHADELAELCPTAEVDRDVLYVESDNILTGAGSAAALDASLHLLRKVYGTRAAGMTARRMVVPPHRDGGQAQFIRSAVPDCDAQTLGPLLTWITENLREPLSVETLARQNAMSARTFARRFREETGTTPHAWITMQRVLRAEELLETTNRSVDQIADDVGFANAATLRHHFTRARGVSPQRYRRTFGASAQTEKAG
jgi:transcriptional regulator GlxA family with amidase domain